MANFHFNKVILGGRLTTDCELKQSPSGLSVTTFSIAINRKGADNKTDFIDVVAWRQTAEFICNYFRKGSSICIVGSLQKREWTDKNGQKRFVTEVIADEVCFVDSKNDVAMNNAPIESVPSAPHFEEIKNTDDLPF
jgi:single-strand DNA-binding protein